ncbi:hypothetical protein HLRTI_003350 [Halorhabdus tiamatea SARL4B]|uniref:Uncharacterized protein n=1 Tax=Halorhabdus tiamatea SARL4B TaxID=1033806 RepID=U2F2U1_9EURY|nr:hypothetical protein HLRTI_003350 [Halorhabdus tiamatea SARL4B]
MHKRLLDHATKRRNNPHVTGRIKDFAEERDLSLSEAYTELLEAGLDTLETQDQQ